MFNDIRNSGEAMKQFQAWLAKTGVRNDNERDVFGMLKILLDFCIKCRIASDCFDNWILAHAGNHLIYIILTISHYFSQLWEAIYPKKLDYALRLIKRFIKLSTIAVASRGSLIWFQFSLFVDFSLHLIILFAKTFFPFSPGNCGSSRFIFGGKERDQCLDVSDDHPHAIPNTRHLDVWGS